MYLQHNENKERETVSLFDVMSEYKIKEKPKSTITNQRQDFTKKFVEEINKQREGTKYKPVTGQAIAIKLGHVKTEDLYAFYKVCKSNKGKTGFSGAFFAKLKA